MTFTIGGQRWRIRTKELFGFTYKLEDFIKPSVIISFHLITCNHAEELYNDYNLINRRGNYAVAASPTLNVIYLKDNST